MNRRSFLATSAAAAFIGAMPLSLTGCDSTTVGEFVNLIASDAAALANFFGAGTIATQITNLASQIAADIKTWQAGGTAQAAIQVINDLIGLVDSIPVATPYAPLIILILSALSGILALLPASTSAVAAKVIGARQVTPATYGGFDKKSMTSAKTQFNSNWNSQLAITPLKK